MDSLDRRLRQLIQGLPVGVRGALGPPPGDAIAAELIGAGRTALAAQLGELRNTLSHGSRNHQDLELLPWVKVVETMCRAHALRLLGFDDASITDGLVVRPAPDPA